MTMENVNNDYEVRLKEELPDSEVENITENNGAEVEDGTEKKDSEVEDEVRVKTEVVDPEQESSRALTSTEESADNFSVGVLTEEMNKSADGGEIETAEDKSGDEGKAATDENHDKLPENASLRAKLRTLVESGKHFLQCTPLVPVEEFERQVSIYKELSDVQLKSFSKELVRSCPIKLTDCAGELIFEVGDLLTAPLEICHTEKYATYAGFNEEEKKFSLGYKKFAKGLPSRELFNPAIKKCYEVILKYVHKSGRPFHVMKRKPPGFWSAVTIVCNKKKELLVQMEVHVTANQYKRQSCELEKLKFISCFTDGPGKDCNILSLQWKEYLGSSGFTNTVLHGKEFLIERFGDLNLRLYPDDFLISKPSGVGLVCRMVRELLDLQESDPKVTILEIGTGTGILGMQLSKVCKRVHMMDRTDKFSIEHAEENVKLNGIPNCFVHHEQMIQSIQKITSTLNENDKLYAVIHNNIDTRRVATEMESIAANKKIKKIVYLNLDHKVRGIKQIRSLCCPSNDAFVPVKIIPVVITPCYSDVDVAVLLVRQSLLEGRTVENELRTYEEPDVANVSVIVTEKNKEHDDDDNDLSSAQEPPHKKQKLWKQQLGGKKGKQKFSKNMRRQRFDRWQGRNRWQGSEQWQDDDECQDNGDLQGMDIRKVGFPGYKPPAVLGENKSPNESNKSQFQQNEKWPKRQQQSLSGRQSHQMNRSFQPSPSSYGNWQPQLNKNQGINFNSSEAGGCEDHSREHQQYSSLQQQPFRNNSQHQFNSSENQRLNSSHNQQYNSQNISQNQQFSPQSQQYNTQSQQYNSQNQQYNPQNQQYNLKNQQFTPLNKQFNPPNQQLNPPNPQFNPPNQQLNPPNPQLNPPNLQLNPPNPQLNLPNPQLNPPNQQLNLQNQQLNLQNQQYTQNQQYNPQNQQQYNLQNQQYKPQNQQNSYTQNQPFYSGNQSNNFQSQQLSNPQQQLFNSSQQNTLSSAPYQQFNSSLQIISSFKPFGQQIQSDVSVKSNVPQVSFDASVKSGDQLNYDTSEKSAGYGRQFVTYGVDYSNANQAQNYGTGWGGQQNSVYNYGYANSGSSMVSNFNMSSTENLVQQNSWTPYLPQTKY